MSAIEAEHDIYILEQVADDLLRAYATPGGHRVLIENEARLRFAAANINALVAAINKSSTAPRVEAA